MIEIIPAADLKQGDVLSTDGYVVTTVVLLPKTNRVFVQAALDGHLKTTTLAQDDTVPLWREDEEIVPESDLTPGSLELFLGLAEDASNWSGTPLVTVDAAGKGHLTHLKKRGLLDTFVDEGCSFAIFTEAGIALAEEHGIDGTYLRFDFLPKAES